MFDYFKFVALPNARILEGYTHLRNSWHCFTHCPLGGVHSTGIYICRNVREIMTGEGDARGYGYACLAQMIPYGRMIVKFLEKNMTAYDPEHDGYRASLQ